MADLTVIERMNKAREFRSEWGYPRGLVIFLGDKVAGWVRDLEGECTYVPDCIAVDESGSEWVAVGGNDYDGADRWENANG
ncbi:hypothetical protein SAMN04488490_1818 [Marinobacter sp. LV10R510-11A]|uniref:hypothetical protein n=1 Tax=Marinobacter sp. LV10R510-11A TaxID=1415568 RepID=UPI000BB6DCC3|nr:hypothetical protein [Marinobacter sp. LV10R510-11A]SOB76142.1 hypothetical protein SAMN04488490_1818 [Marinobacter sp. LV10R510-11A]